MRRIVENNWSDKTKPEPNASDSIIYATAGRAWKIPHLFNAFSFFDDRKNMEFGNMTRSSDVVGSI